MIDNQDVLTSSDEFKDNHENKKNDGYSTQHTMIFFVKWALAA